MKGPGSEGNGSAFQLARSSGDVCHGRPAHDRPAARAGAEAKAETGLNASQTAPGIYPIFGQYRTCGRF